jgi:hypothetical protein
MEYNRKKIYLMDSMNCFRHSKGFQNCLLNYMEFQKKRTKTGKILNPLFQPILNSKLFCDVNDIIINRKIVSRGIAKGRHA